MCTEIMAVCSENYQRHINTLWTHFRTV